MIIVSDTSAISNLAIVGHLDLLRQLYSSVIIPTAVYQELLDSQAVEVLVIQTLDWIETRSVSDLNFLKTLKLNLDEGEAEAIALAVELKADRLVIDERRGRNIAMQAGLEVIGLLGILLAAKRRGFVPLVKPILDALVTQGFWVHDALYAEVLIVAGE